MSAENLTPYSKTTVYGELTSPFTPKQITINAHTPFDKVEENESKAYSRVDFSGKPQTKIIYSKLANNYEIEIEKEDNEIFKQNELSNFSISEFTDDNILKGVLSSDYSPEEAAIIKKAEEAYKKSITMTKKAPENLSKCSYRVW